MKKTPQFYKEQVCLNVLANSVENAKECYEAAEGNIVLGVLSKNYETDESAISDMKKYQEATNNALSVGLGAGDPNQSQMVIRLSEVLQPQHVNQVFTGVGGTRSTLKQQDTFVNALISPTGKVGLVNIATGPLSSTYKAGEVSIETAIMMLKDMGASSVKFFSMEGLKYIEEYRELAKKCAEFDFALEPTGGIDLENFEEIVQIAVDAGVKKIIPHIYSSVIDPVTGNTRPEDVKVLYNTVKKILDK